MLDAVTEDDLRDIVRALVERAKDGDIVAAREILTRVIGKPAEAVDPDRVEIHELRIDREAVDAESELNWARISQ